MMDVTNLIGMFYRSAPLGSSTKGESDERELVIPSFIGSTDMCHQIDNALGRRAGHLAQLRPLFALLLIAWPAFFPGAGRV